jgi:arylformamidase
MLYDITPTITDALAVWPGDTPPRREVLREMERGDNLTLSTLHATVHLGAHADAPSHYGADAPSIEQCPLDLYLGPCRVVSVAVARGKTVLPEDLPEQAAGERILLATGSYPDPDRFNRDFAAISPEAIDLLRSRGARLIGVDTPSVDPFDSVELPAHQSCLRHGVALLEGLLLEGVPDGDYELIALPLKLAGFDASPVRAVLRKSV